MSNASKISKVALGKLFLVGLVLCSSGCTGSNRPGSASDLDGIQGVAGRFLRSVEAGLLDQAYSVTTEAFQARMSRQAFADFIEENSVLRQRHQLQGLGISRDRSATQCHYLFVVNEQRFELQILYENSQWKVNELNKLD